MNRQRITILTKTQLRKVIRNPAYLFLLILFPTVLTLIFGLVFNDPESGMNFNLMVPGLFAYACIFMIMTIAQSFSDERQEGLLKRMNTTPMSSSDFMLSQIISNMFIAIIQMVLVFIVSVLFGFRPLGGILGVLMAFIMMAIFSLSSIGLGLITATISKTPEIATGVSFIFILPQMFFGTFLPLYGPVQTVGKFFPAYYLTDALSSIFEGSSLMSANILLDFAIITIFGIAIVFIGILLFNKYGNAL
ncbi:MAG: ABC transporter permease [Promethearchaeota archaeon]